jgi:hypothetical protein
MKLARSAGTTMNHPHMFLVDRPMSQPSLNISPIWTSVTAEEVSNSQLDPF